MPFVLGLSRAEGSGEIIIIESGIDDFVAVLIEVSRFETAYDAVSAVEKEDFHGLTDSALSLLRISRLSLPIEGSRHREV